MKKADKNPPAKVRAQKAAKPTPKPPSAKVPGSAVPKDKAPPKERFDVDAAGLVWHKKDGSIERLPSLVNVCHDLYLKGCKRHYVQAYCTERYGCSAATIDRAWALAKHIAWGPEQEGKMERNREAAARLDYIYAESLKAKDRTNARHSVKDKARILGDDRPDPLGGLMDSGTVEELTRQVTQQEALLVKALKDAGLAVPPELGGKAPKPKKAA